MCRQLLTSYPTVYGETLKYVSSAPLLTHVV